MKGCIRCHGPTDHKGNCERCDRERTALGPSDATDCSGWVGKLVHDRSGYADWGWIRDEAGDLIIIVKTPPMTEEDENRHRRAGTDPAQARVDAVLAAINGQNAPADLPATVDSASRKDVIAG